MAFFAQLLASLSQMAMIMMVLYLLAQAGLLQSLMQFINPQQAQPGQRVLNNAQATARPGPQLPPAPSKSAGKKKKGKKSDDAGEQQVNACVGRALQCFGVAEHNGFGVHGLPVAAVGQQSHWVSRCGR